MLILSEMFWDALLEEFRWPRRAVERVGYIDGFQFGERRVATTLTFPSAEMHATHFTVPGNAMSEAGKHFRRFGMVRLAQVHTHPGRDVTHSPFDDDNAYSQLGGSLSIVIPQHARYRPDLTHCGIHVRETAGWRLFNAKESAETILVVPGCLD